MKTRLLLMVLLSVLLVWSEGHCGFWLVGETVAEESSGEEIAFVQSGTVYGTSLTMTGVTAGNLLIACGNGNSALTSSTITDDNSNSWTAMTDHVFAGTNKIRCFYSNNVNAGDTEITLNSPPGDPGFAVHEYSGIADSSAFGQESANDVGLDAGTFDSHAITTTSSNVLLFGYAGDVQNTVDYTWGGSMTERTETLTHTHSSADRIVTSTGTYSAVGTRGGGAAVASAVIMSFVGASQ